VAIYPSRFRWQVLLVSLISIVERRCRHTIFFSLTSDINPTSKTPRVPTAREGMRINGDQLPGVRVHYILLLAVCQFLSSPVSGYFEGR
jgi:hypothetical protein